MSILEICLSVRIIIAQYRFCCVKRQYSKKSRGWNWCLPPAQAPGLTLRDKGGSPTPYPALWKVSTEVGFLLGSWWKSISSSQRHLVEGWWEVIIWGVTLWAQSTKYMPNPPQSKVLTTEVDFKLKLDNLLSRILQKWFVHSVETWTKWPLRLTPTLRDWNRILGLGRQPFSSGPAECTVCHSSVPRTPLLSK